MSGGLVPGGLTVAFTHAGSYGSSPNGDPVVELEMAAVDRESRFLGASRETVLVDSGAQGTLLNADTASRLGLDLSERQYRKSSVRGVGNASLPVTYAPILIELCSRWLMVDAAFSTADIVRPLLGRAQVFDQVTFAFGHGARLVYAA